MSVTVHHGDSREVLKGIPDCSIDSVASDPPYALVSIVKRFGREGAAPAKSEGASGVYSRASAGFMGEAWDTGETAFDPLFWAEVLRVLKPGGHLVACGGTRSYHRLVCAIEDAGFEIRDQLAWLYGSGFPKSHNVAKGIDRAADYKLQSAVRRAAVEAVEAAGLNLPSNSRHDWTAGEHAPGDKWWREFQTWLPGLSDADRERVEGEIIATVRKTAGWFTRGDIYSITAPATSGAIEWDGWGTALKPALEPIVLARKPLIGTVAANVMAHGTGALNIDGCRISTGGEKISPRGSMDGATDIHEGWARPWMADEAKTKARLVNAIEKAESLGRWPANVIHDGSEEVVSAFPVAPGQLAPISTKPGVKTSIVYGKMNRAGEASADRRYTDAGSTNFAPLPGQRRGDEGSAARFFYSAKADAEDRLGSRHPTVKPVDLMRWLVRLITPPGGTVLDPFAGTGTTGIAAMAEGFDAVLIEREAKYVADIERRIAWAKGEGRLTSQEMARLDTPESLAKANGADLPLFAGDAA